MKNQKKRRNRLLAFFVIVVPMIAACVYYGLFAVDRYVTTAQVVVRQTGSSGQAQQIPALSLLVSGINPASREETLYLRQYIDSMEMLNVLQEKLNWREHYAQQVSDPLFWLSKDTPSEDVLKYYRRLVTVHFDELTGLLGIQVEAFSPEFAESVIKVMLEESDRYVNEMSLKLARQQMEFARVELKIARQNYVDRRAALITFQSENNLLDAQASAESRAGIVAALESQLTEANATLRGLQSTLSPAAPRVRQERTTIAALEAQLAAERKRLVSQQEGGQLNVVAAAFRNLSVDAQIAEEGYKTSLVALENARIESSKKIRALVTVVGANDPDIPLFPRRLYNLFTMLVGLVLAYGIIRFILESVEDHRD